MSTPYCTISGGLLQADWPEDYGVSGTLAIFTTENFVADDGASWLAGTGETLTGAFVTESAISVVSGAASYAAFTLPTTDTSRPNTIRYFGVIFDQWGGRRDDLFADRHLRASLGSSISMLQWANDQQAPFRPQADTKPTTNDLNTAILAALANIGLDQDYSLNQFASFAAAITAVTATGGTLVINSATSCTVNTAVPANTTLRFTRKGSITISNGVTLTLAKTPEAGFHKIFNGSGLVVFSAAASREVKADWWGDNTAPGTTDMTGAILSAEVALAGQGVINFSGNSYLITDSIIFSALTGNFSKLVLRGTGRFATNLINKASAGKPTISITRDLVNIEQLGIWGDNSFPNHGIKISAAGRIRIEDCIIYVKGSAIYLEQAQSVWIQRNYGGISSGFALVPTGVTTPIASFAATDSFIYANIPNGGFANHIVIRDNMNEGYSYQVYMNQSGNGYGLNWIGSGNQWEGSTNGVYMKGVNVFDIKDNYMQEGSTGYGFELNNCRYGKLGPNYLHLNNDDFDAVANTVKLVDVLGTTLLGSYPRLLLQGLSTGSGMGQGSAVGRIQDETTDRRFSYENTLSLNLNVPKGIFNATTGKRTWFSDSTMFFSAYPTVSAGDVILKVTPAAGTSPGWECVTGASTGGLVQTVGSGPGPIPGGDPAAPDYADPVAYDFRITLLTGGVTGTATYKVEWKTAGSGSYADLTGTLATTEMAHVMQRVSGGPVVSFSLGWPTGVTYVSGNIWTFTGVVAPVWKALPALAA